MPFIERILVPIDLTDFGVAALEWADLFRFHEGSEITLLHAYPPPNPLALEHPMGYYLENAADEKRQFLIQLRNFAIDHGVDDPDLKTMACGDDPARAIIAAAEDIDASLIVMGTHGRTGWKRLVLGSVTEGVLRQTRRPVLTVAPTRGNGKHPHLGRILCPVNFTNIGRLALEEACRFAERFNAFLIALHVIEENAVLHDVALQWRFRQWIAPAVRDRARVSEVIVHGDAAERVLEVAEQSNVDLIVIGAERHRFADRTILGTTSERIARSSRRPVLTITRAAAARSREEEEAELVSV